MAVSGQAFAESDSSAVAPVRREEELTLDALIGLFEGDDLALSVPDFCPGTVCDHIAGRVVGHPHVSGYVVEPAFRRLGTSFYDTASKPELLEAYHDAAGREMQELRALCGPYRSPLDELRCKLDEVWPWGASVARLGGRRMKAGTARVCGDGGGAQAHVDSLGFDARAFADAPVLRRQVSANVFLRLPDRGGEFAIWERRVVTAVDEAAYRLWSSPYALDEAKLGPPALTVRPRRGELIVFDSNHPHAVRPCQGGARVTMGLFVGYAGEGLPLCLWN